MTDNKPAGAETNSRMTQDEVDADPQLNFTDVRVVEESSREDFELDPLFAFSSPDPAVSTTLVSMEAAGVKAKNDIAVMVELLREEDGGYVAHVPSLPSASTQGKDLEEAMKMVTENLTAILESEGEPNLLPPDEVEYLGSRRDRVIIRIPVPDEAATTEGP